MMLCSFPFEAPSYSTHLPESYDDTKELVFLASQAADEPLKFRVVSETVVEILPDLSGSEPESKQRVWIALGTAAEALLTAAGGGSYYVAGGKIRATMSQGRGLSTIARLQDYVFDGREADVGFLESVPLEAGVELHTYDKASLPWIVVKEMVRRAYRERVSTKVSPLQTLPLVGTFFEPDADKLSNADLRKIESSSHLILLTTTDPELPASWVRVGASLERLILACDAKGLAAAALTQCLEVEKVQRDLHTTLNLPGDVKPACLLRVGFCAAKKYTRPGSIDIDDVLE